MDYNKILNKVKVALILYFKNINSSIVSIVKRMSMIKYWLKCTIIKSFSF